MAGTADAVPVFIYWRHRDNYKSKEKRRRKIFYERKKDNRSFDRIVYGDDMGDNLYFIKDFA